MTELTQEEDIKLFFEYIKQKIAIREAKTTFSEVKQQQKEEDS